ncbi:MAG: aquaporin [Thermoplasmatota archaeon]
MADATTDMGIDWKKAVAEFVGTFTLIYIGSLVLVSIPFAGRTLVDAAFAHGLAIAVMVSATMMISGGQLNPAVTLGLLIGRQITLMEAVVNWIAQLLGGIVGGYFALYSVAPASMGPSVPALAAGVSTQTGLLVEAVLTFFLVFVVYGTGVDKRFGARIGGLAIGLTITMDILAGGAITGASMNPARWIGSLVPAGNYANAASGAVVYIVGPLVGGIVAGLIWGWFLLDAKKESFEVGN